MKKFLLLLAFLPFIAQGNLSAQEKEKFIPGAETNSLVKIHIIAFGIGVEQAVDPNVSVYFDVAFGNDYHRESEESELDYVPYFTVEPRYYFNLDDRLEKGKRIDNFSGQFVTFQTKVGFPTVNMTAWYSLSPMWGFQSMIGKRAYWSFQAGPGLQGSAGKIYSDFSGDITFGFVL
ncbi:MAG: hypothetical protein JXA77_08165 [Bacteroidales bacterium]|nr:hypothetical protein [Bacteroidales bacterium]MBN2818606.1 hypothetical protein [Bacteroidales bacterium]